MLSAVTATPCLEHQRSPVQTLSQSFTVSSQELPGALFHCNGSSIPVPGSLIFSVPATEQGQLCEKYHRGQLPSQDSDGQVKHLAVFWLNQIKPESSSFSRKLNPTKSKTKIKPTTSQPVQQSKLVMSKNFPLSGLSLLPLPIPGQCSNSTQWMLSNKEWAVHFQLLVCLLPFPGISCPLMVLRCQQQLFTVSLLLPHSVHSFTQPGPHQSPSVPLQLSPGYRKVWVTSQAFPRPIENLGFSVHTCSPQSPLLLASLCGHWSTERQKRPGSPTTPPQDPQTEKELHQSLPLHPSSMPNPPNSLS